MDLKIVPCNYNAHAAAILDIFNDAILNSTALYEYEPRTMEFMATWFTAKAQANFPVIGAEDQDGKLVGFASYGHFRNWPAYKYSVEHSVYVHKDSRGAGVGTLLMREVIRTVQQNGYHMLIGGIDATNQPSIRLHERLGFAHCATIAHAGFKFGNWLDLVFYQLLLPTPEEPVDG